MSMYKNTEKNTKKKIRKKIRKKFSVFFQYSNTKLKQLFNSYFFHFEQEMALILKLIGIIGCVSFAL